MNSISFKLKPSKRDKIGRCPVFLEFNHNAQTLVCATGEKCLQNEWDAEKQKFRRSMQGFQEANEHLELLRDKVRRAYRDLRNRDEEVNNEQLKVAITGKGRKVQSVDLVLVFERYLANRGEMGRLKNSTLHAIRTSYVRLKRFDESNSEMQLKVDGYTNEVHESFLNYLFNDQDLEPSSVSATCKHLITFFKWCEENYKLHPQHASIKRDSQESTRVYLTDQELRKLETVALPPHLSRVRDAFLFQCFTGLRYADLWRLQTHNIEQRTGYSVICLIPEKTVGRSGKIKRVEIPLLPDAIRILDRYTGNYRLLPVLSNQKYNDFIKEVAQMAEITDTVEVIKYEKGIPKLAPVEKWRQLSSHVARHTFATLSLMKGVPLEVVSKVLGHTSLKTTMIYAKVVDEWKNQAILKAWGNR